MAEPTFLHLLLPSVQASRNRARRRERGDLLRGIVVGIIGVVVGAARVSSRTSSAA